MTSDLAKRKTIMSEIFMSDSKEINLHAEKIKVMQDLVDMDLKLFGKVSSDTWEVLKVQHCTIDENNQIVEKQEEIEMQKSEEWKKEYISEHAERLTVQMLSQPKRTLVVNAYAGPGAGKTTACLSTVAALKKMGYSAEYVSEYAKDLVYDNPSLLDGTEEHQFDILQEQIKRMDRYMGKVDIIVTDAPILLNSVYNKELTPEYEEMVSMLYNQYDNFNFFVKRGEIFEQEGRIHNNEESIKKDAEIEDILKKKELFYGTFNHKTVDKLADKIKITYERIKNEGRNISELHLFSAQNTGEKNVTKEQSYQGSAYLKGTGDKQKPTLLYGDTPDAIITILQEWNRARTSEMQFHSCYIRKLNPDTNKYENAAKYEVATGIDVTPIYLSLPHMGKEKFLKTVSELKDKGAKYNPVKKAFYITKQEDLNKFAAYIPIAGTHAQDGENHSKNELAYDVEAGQDYYDNRILLTVEGMEPINIYGDKYDVHFPSMSAESTKEIIEKFILPSFDFESRLKEVPKEVEYNGKKYDPLQYEILQLAISQKFTKEKMELLEHPELAADRMNEVRFAIRDGLSAEQISQFATPAHEQWQMDICRIGMQHGLTYEELLPVIEKKGYTPEKWSERRNQLSKMVKEKEINTRITSDLPHLGTLNGKDENSSVLLKLSQNKEEIDNKKVGGKDMVMQHGER